MPSQENAQNRIDEDLQILIEMAKAIPAYLASTSAYYPLANPSLPKLSLGSYLMRQERLLALHHQLSEVDKGRLDTAVSQFQHAISEHIVALEKKGQEEIQIRLRQWQQAVTELEEEPADSVPYYATAVENRVMLSALLSYLQQAPYQPDKTVLTDVDGVDQRLKAIWQSGEFVWPTVWQAAYPPDLY